MDTINRHPSGCVEMTESGLYDVVNTEGHSLLGPFGGPFHNAEAAQAVQRMLTAFDAVSATINQINETLGRVNISI